MIEKVTILNTPLREHQINNLRFHLSYPKTADWSDCGVGKTLISLAKFEMLKVVDNKKTMLVVCPLSVIESWVGEIEKHTSFSYVRLIGTVEQKMGLLNQAADIYLITYDAIAGRKSTTGRLLNALIEKKFSYICADEATMVKSFGALRTKALTKLCDTVPYSMFLSGTPVTNNIASVFTIYRAMDGGATFGKNYFITRNRYFKDVGTAFPQLVLKEEYAQELRMRLFQRAIRVMKTECLQLPPQIIMPRYCYLSDEQEKMYVMVASDLIKTLDLPEGSINVSNVLAKMAKLSQIVDGFMYTDDETKFFAPNPKVELLKETLELIPEGEKVVIYARWIEDLNSIERCVKELRLPSVRIDGSTKLEDRGKYVKSFQEDPETKIFIAQEATGGYGITLHSAWNAIYFSFTFAVIDYMQSQARIHRLGQTAAKCCYYPLFGKDTIDEYIWNSLQGKVEVAQSLTDQAERQRLKDNLYLIVGRNDGKETKAQGEGNIPIESEGLSSIHPSEKGTEEHEESATS